MLLASDAQALASDSISCMRTCNREGSRAQDTMLLRRVAAYAAILLFASCASNNVPRQTWELMVPPPSKGAVYGYDLQAPLADWERLTDAGYETNGECQNSLANTLQDWNQQSGWSRNASEGTFNTQLDRLRAGVCVTTNDPRLRGRHNSQF
jgi:hypothetical protein